MTTTSTDDVASVLAARKSEIQAGPPATEYPEVIPPATASGEIVPASTATATPSGGGTPRPPAAPSAAVEPARPPDYSMIPAKVLGGIPYASEYARLAKTICNTEMVPGAMRGAWDKVMAAFMRGYELGLGPMQALDSFNVIDGKVGLGAESMRALTIEAGHQILLDETIDPDTGKVIGIRADCRRADWPEGQWRSYSFTMEDAAMAGLLKTPRSGNPGSWQKYPRAMMEARATSGACRRYFPDVLAGMSYTPEEIRDFDGPQEEVPPSPAAVAPASNGPLPDQQTPPPSSPPPPSPSPASAPETSSAPSPAPAPAADSMGSASATSSPAAASSAPPTSSTPPAKKAGGTKKAAAKKAAPAAVSAPPQEASTAPPAAAEAAAAPPATPAPATTAPTSTPSDGEAGVLRQMASALVEIISGQPQAQQSLLRAFLRQHYPNGIDTITDPDEMQAAIDIAVGWPDSANQHPPPAPPGEEKWRGFSSGVYEVERELISRCDLCEWHLEEAATNVNLPEFRRLELAAAVCISHEQDSYADGTPYCPGRPMQQSLGAGEERTADS